MTMKSLFLFALTTNICHVFVSGIVSNFSNVINNGSAYKTFTCNPNEDCYFYCSGEYGCAYATLNASNANNVYIECRDHHSCERMNFYINNDVNLTIMCNSTINPDGSDGSCEYINVYASNVNNVNIQCVNMFDCSWSDFWIENAKKAEINVYSEKAAYYAEFHTENVSEKVHFVCVGHYSCRVLWVYCPVSSTNTSCEIECIGEGSCEHILIEIEDSSYNNLDLSCDNIRVQDDIILTYNYTCINEFAYLRCIDTAYSSHLFYNKYDGELSCHASCCPFEINEIECNDNTDECLIDCTDTFCDGHLINATDKTSLTVNCDTSDTITSTCYGLTIHCPFEGICSINCNLEYGCYRMHIIGYEDTQIHLKCAAFGTCQETEVWGSNSKEIVINATATYSFYQTWVHAENTKSLSLNCINSDVNKWDQPICSFFVLALSSNLDDKININCWGQACFYTMLFSEEGITSNMNITVHSSCQCPNGTIDNCCNYWSIICSNEYSVHAGFDGNLCYDTGEGDQWEYTLMNDDDDDICGCFKLKSIINNNYIDNDKEVETKFNVDCCYDYYMLVDPESKCNDTDTDTDSSDDSYNNPDQHAIIIGVVLSMILLYQ